MQAQAASAISPMLRADATAAPGLLIHGEADAVVEVEDSRALAAALSNRADVTYLQPPDVVQDLQSAVARPAVLARSAALLDEAMR